MVLGDNARLALQKWELGQKHASKKLAHCTKAQLTVVTEQWGPAALSAHCTPACPEGPAQGRDSWMNAEVSLASYRASTTPSACES